MSLQAFKKFKDTKEALVANDKLIKGMFPKTLKKFLEKNAINDEVQEKLAGKMQFFSSPELTNFQSPIRD